MGHGTQVSTRIRTHNSSQSGANACQDLSERVERSHMLRITILGHLYQITRQFQIWRFVHTLHPLTCLRAMFSLLTNVVYSSYDAGTITPNWNVSCLTGTHNWSWHAPSAMPVHFQMFNGIGLFLFVAINSLSRFPFTTLPETHQQ